ncbi:MAG: CBS domain-containing protein, partial [Bacteroidota bacterium]
ITVTPTTLLTEAKELFEKHGIHHLPVVDFAGDVRGLISNTDYLKLATTPANIVGDIMSTKLAKLESGDTVRTAAALLRLNRFHALPVMDDGKLVGIITSLDLIKLLVEEPVELKDYANA